MTYRRVGLILALLAFSACKPGGASRDEPKSNENPKVVLGQVSMGNETSEFYIAYGPDEGILGFSVPDGKGQVRYFPMFAATYRGMPAVTLDVFVSKAEDEMWVRSSWPTAETLAYRRVGADSAITQFGNVAFVRELLPKTLSGGPISFPEMVAGNVSKKATFQVKEER